MAKQRARFLSHEQARRFYDRLGAKLDTQAFYEDAVLHELVAHLGMADCRSVVEFGCGTGRLAEELLAAVLSPRATYLGLDVSSTMVTLASGRLKQWRDRAVIQQSDGTFHIETPEGHADRFICTYVLDLLSEGDIQAVVAEAHRVLASDGLLGLVSLTNGAKPLSRLVATAWQKLHALSPWIVGGCRPIVIERFLPEGAWKIEYSRVMSRFGIPSEIIVARRV